MDRTTSLVIGLVLCVVFIIALLVAFPLGKTGALAEPPAHGEIGLRRTEDRLAISHPSASLDFTPSFTLTLPIVLSGYRYHPPCTLDSPFSIEIAAINEIVPDEEWDTPERALAEAQWLERLEEGYPTLVEALAESGACWTRVELRWSQIQPEPPPAPYKFTYFDERLLALADSGVQIIGLVHNVPYWAGDYPAGPIYADQVPAFAQFLTDLVSRYKQPPYNIHHWELINEPDQTHQEEKGFLGGYGDYGTEYAEMLASAYAAIKAADASATVLMGGIAYDWFEEYGELGGPFNRYFPDDVMAAGGGDFMDTTNFHYFTDFRLEWEQWNTGDPPTCGDVDDGLGATYEAGGIDIIAKATHFRNRLRVCSGIDKPIWLTELAENGFAGDLDSLGQQARYVIQGYSRALAVGIENVTWFALVSPWYDEFEQGLLYENDWSPKPAYYAYQTMAEQLAGYQYSRTLDVPKVEGYVFRYGSGSQRVVAWSSGVAYESGSLTFAPATKLQVVDREGHVTVIQDGGLGDVDQVLGSVTIRLPAVPVDPDPTDHVWYTAEPLFVSWR